MREWQGAINRNADAPEDVRRWAQAMVDDPDHNPDRRLDQASSHRRGQLMKYILIGPDTARRRTYKAASWAAQTYQAMQNIGIFFVFEVMGRAVQSMFSPPVPAEAIRDAQAAWLADTPEPQSDEAQSLAKALAKADVRDGRFADARATLDRAGLLDAKKKQKLDKTEARRLARLAEENPESSSTLAARARALDPNVKIKFKKQKPKKEQSVWHLDWETLAGWSGRPLPAGLPGSAEWFDGKPGNGEITADGLWLERPDPKERDRLTLRYPVQYPNERRVFQQEVRASGLPKRIRDWLGLSGALGDESREKLHRLKRLPIPMAVEGGAGMSGIDFHPRLMPIETRPGELELYR
ncbi:hypothetical protein LLG95_01595, partial [bacterium]|nr:hypothetical protein [bacterium]